MLYGGTPYNSKSVTYRFTKWAAAGDGHVCPFTPCPFCNADGKLIWSDADRVAGKERLVCASCGAVVDNMALTRKSLRQHPADILFTTTEMVNRSLGDPWTRSLVGSTVDSKVDLVLLDEVHTYGGVHGAHVAALIRRWRGMQGSRRTHFVGLSATLADAAEFFASITGLDSHRVNHVAPQPADLVTEGHEYQIALRSDPYSRAGVLSTSIQAAMLIARVMDPPTGNRSHGAFGERVFAFTDDLDVTNRLYFDLLDAEGRGARNFVKDKAPLASLRRPAGDDLPARRDAGQVWDLPQSLGWPLDSRGRKADC